MQLGWLNDLPSNLWKAEASENSKGIWREEEILDASVTLKNESFYAFAHLFCSNNLGSSAHLKKSYTLKELYSVPGLLTSYLLVCTGTVMLLTAFPSHLMHFQPKDK